MIRHHNTFIALFLAALLSACAYTESDLEIEDYDYRARYPLGVETTVVAAAFQGAAGGQLSTAERDALSRMVADYVNRGQAPLTVLVGGSGLTQETLAEEIRSSAVDHGLAKSEVIVGVDPTLAAGEVEVSFVSYTAIVPECGYWNEESYASYNNANSFNFGCASQHNLGIMVADPSDLIEPGEFASRDGQRSVDVIDLYRAGEVTGAEYNDSGLAISDVGE